MIVVLDASALLAAALHEPGGDIVKQHILQENRVIIHAINAFEVVTKLTMYGVPPDGAWQMLYPEHVIRVNEINDDVLTIAIRLKSGHQSLSLADCFCIALGDFVGGVVLTGDRAFTRAQTSAEIRLIRHV